MKFSSEPSDPINLTDTVGILLVALSLWGCLWLLSKTEWRDRYGDIKIMSRQAVPWWRSGQSPWWDEVNDGLIPGRQP